MISLIASFSAPFSIITRRNEAFKGTAKTRSLSLHSSTEYFGSPAVYPRYSSEKLPLDDTMGNIDLESERLIYKRVSEEHLTDDYVNWINDPEVNMYLETRGNYTLDLLTSYVEEQYNKEVYFWAIHLKNSKKHIGNIKIDPIHSKANSGEYGILMGDKLSWGKGYAKEASFTIIKYCFETILLNK
jgi:RimJ/RimL family protein N-acetyltransferase